MIIHTAMERKMLDIKWQDYISNKTVEDSRWLPMMTIMSAAYCPAANPVPYCQNIHLGVFCSDKSTERVRMRCLGSYCTMAREMR